RRPAPHPRRRVAPPHAHRSGRVRARSVSSEVALDVCTGVVMSQERDSFASARSPGRVTLCDQRPLPRKESSRDLRRHPPPLQDFPPPRPPPPCPPRPPPPLGGRLRLPPRPHARLRGRCRRPLPGPPPRPARPLPATLPLVQGLAPPHRRRRPPPATGGTPRRHLGLHPGPNLRRPAGRQDRKHLQPRQLPPAQEEGPAQEPQARQAL